MRRGLLLGVSVLWIPLAFLFDGVTVLLLPLRLGGDASAIGLVSLAGLGLAAALQPIAGWLTDRLRGTVERRGFLLVGAAPALVGLAVFAGRGGVAAVVAGYVLVQAAATVMQAAQQTFIPEHVEPTRRGRAAGLKAAFDVGGSFVAFLALGVLLANGDLVAAAALIAVVLVIAVTLVFLLVPATPRVRVTRPAASLPAGFAHLVVARFLFLFGTYAVGRFLVLLVADRLRIPADRALGDAGGLLALLTLTTAVTALAIGRVADRRERTGLMAAGALVAAAGILLLVPAAGIALVVLGGLAMSVGTAAFVTANWAATTDLVPAADAGRLMAIANLGTGLAAAAAGVLGPVIDTVGFAPALVVAAGVSAAAVAPLVLHGRPVRSHEEALT